MMKNTGVHKLGWTRLEEKYGPTQSNRVGKKWTLSVEYVKVNLTQKIRVG